MQVTTNDEQWNDGTILLAPMFYFGIFSLSGIFYFRSTYFTLKSQAGPQFVNLNNSTRIKKSAFIRNMLSWVFIILTLTTLAEGTNYFGDSYESVEYGEDENGVYDYSTLIEESEIVTKCTYNEECVAANILNDGFFFSFLAPNNMTFAEGDPSEYNQVTGILAPIFFIFMTWYSFCLISWLYCLALRKIPDEYADYYEWRDYFDRKANRSYGVFLLCIASILPTAFLFSNPSTSLSLSGLVTILISLVVIYYIILFFYSYDKGFVIDYSVDDAYRIAPAVILLVLIVSAFLIAVISSPTDNVTDIWLYDWIIGFDDFLTFYTDSTNFRYILVDLFATGATLLVPALIVAFIMEEEIVDEIWYLIPGAVGLFSCVHILLSLWGFIAMVGIEIISFNIAWINPIVMFLALCMSSVFIVDTENIMLQYNNSNKSIQTNIPTPYPPLPTTGLPEGWTMEQWQLYGINFSSAQTPPPNGYQPPQHQSLPPQPGKHRASSLAEQRKPVATEMLVSSPMPKDKPHTISVDSKGITTIETKFSIVTLNKFTMEVSKVPNGKHQNEMFNHEIKNMLHLENKGYEVGLLDYQLGEAPKIVTRYMGPSKLSEQYTTLSKQGKQSMINDLVSNITEIHNYGIVHRDLKPDNILVDARPRNGNHKFAAIIDYGIAMKVNRRQTELYNTAATIFFGHSSQKDTNFNASTGQDWFAMARIIALIIRGTDIDTLDAEINMSMNGLNLEKELTAVGFNDDQVNILQSMISLATQHNCQENDIVEQISEVGKILAKHF